MDAPNLAGPSSRDAADGFRIIGRLRLGCGRSEQSSYSSRNAGTSGYSCWRFFSNSTKYVASPICTGQRVVGRRLVELRRACGPTVSPQIHKAYVVPVPRDVLHPRFAIDIQVKR